jgi:hypothetical protein
LNIEKLLSPRQLEVWNYVQDANKVTPRELAENLGIPRPAINQVLDRLLDLKKIERLGFCRGTSTHVLGGCIEWKVLFYSIIKVQLQDFFILKRTETNNLLPVRCVEAIFKSTDEKGALQWLGCPQCPRV